MTPRVLPPFGARFSSLAASEDGGETAALPGAAGVAFLDTALDPAPDALALAAGGFGDDLCASSHATSSARSTPRHSARIIMGRKALAISGTSRFLDPAIQKNDT